MKRLIAIIFFVELAGSIESQSRTSEFSVLNAQYVDSFLSWDEFVEYTNNWITYINGRNLNGILTYAQLVRQLTPLEEQLVDRDNQQLSSRTSIYSAWNVRAEHRYSLTTYDVYFYSDPDGKRCYRLIRLTGYP
jgi:hypothetical protein